MRAALRLRHLAPALLGALLACGDAPPAPPEAGAVARPEPNPHAGPPGARWDLVDMLRTEETLTFHPSDGGGRAWLESVEPPRPSVGSSARFTLVFEVGPHGIASGGKIFLQVSPFWGWSDPQTAAPHAPGFTTVTPEAPDVALQARRVHQQLMMITVTGRALEPGERIRVVYGAGAAGATVDRYADAEARLWFAVDGDGDGLRRALPDSPYVAVTAGAPARLLVTLPTVARPGETVRVCVAVLDASGNRGVAVSGDVQLEGGGPVLELPTRVPLAPEDAGVKVLEARVREAGVVRLKAVGPGGLETISNPLVVTRTGPRVLWGDLHGHSGLTDGTGTPSDYFGYARDVAGLDVVALTDHDHWGMRPLVKTRENWERIRRVTQRFHDPGRFVTLLGFEWTSWIHGHRHVLYFTDAGEVIDSIDPAFESPQQLWAALEGQQALTFAHHSAGGPIRTNWEIPPDPHFEPLTEIVSVHGSSEALDSPTLIYSPVPGNFVRDVLDRGYRLGFLGSGDSHDGHPGLAQFAAISGGLAAILSEELTREGVLAALRARRVYATNGARILLRTALGAHRMGETLRLDEGAAEPQDLFVSVVAASPLERLDLIRSGVLVDSVDLQGGLEATLQRPIEGLRAGEYLYVRVVQRNGGTAWSSPFFVE